MIRFNIKYLVPDPSVIHGMVFQDACSFLTYNWSSAKEIDVKTVPLMHLVLPKIIKLHPGSKGKDNANITLGMHATKLSMIQKFGMPQNWACMLKV